MKDWGFFNNNKEKDLYDSNIIDYINMFGIPVKYLKRTESNPDTLFGEDPTSVFSYENVHHLKMFTENTTQFDGVDDLFSKFGLQVDNQAVLYVHKATIENLLNGIPLPDDLIYIPQMNRVFEIVKADPKGLFYLFGNITTYRITLKLMEYSQEQMDTNIYEIDNLEGNTNIDDSLQDNMSSTSTLVQTVVDFDEDNPFNEF